MTEFPQRFVNVPVDGGVDAASVHDWVKQRANQRREELWLMLEKEMTDGLKEHQFLAGTERPTLLDLFVAMMGHFMPHIKCGTKWFINNCPRIYRRVKDIMSISIVRETFKKSGLDEYMPEE
ncbi:glutathione S-transferase [Ceratobasidium sp. AG-Ba]|nr:glutathione S-transferase [Ceratobasidium sp. AG-Ba]